MGRKPSCMCGVCAKCKHREAARLLWQSLTLEERRAVVARRDKARVRESEKQRNQKPERLAYLAANTKRWRDAHPGRARAHSAVAYALRTGKLSRGPCEVCGIAKVHAHHDDYAKPLEVRWLCPLHHSAVTKEKSA